MIIVSLNIRNCLWVPLCRWAFQICLFISVILCARNQLHNAEFRFKFWLPRVDDSPTEWVRSCVIELVVVARVVYTFFARFCLPWTGRVINVVRRTALSHRRLEQNGASLEWIFKIHEYPFAHKCRRFDFMCCGCGGDFTPVCIRWDFHHPKAEPLFVRDVVNGNYFLFLLFHHQPTTATTATQKFCIKTVYGHESVDCLLGSMTYNLNGIE